MGKGITVYFVTKDMETIERIRKYFDISGGMSVNGEVYAEIEESKWPMLVKTAQCGFIQLRNKKNHGKSK